MPVPRSRRLGRVSAPAVGLALCFAGMLAGCAQGEPEVATLRTEASASSGSASGTPSPQELDQYGRAEALEACLVDAGLPAILTPMDGGEAQVDWAEGHEVLARDLEQHAMLLEGPGGEISQAVHDAFMDVEVDESTSDLAPSLWVDGKDHTGTWTACLESSGYTNPTAYMEEDPAEALAFSQRYADATNDWAACARENGFPWLKDVTVDGDNGPFGPHVEIPLETEPALLRTMVAACPIFDEELARRRLEGDVTVDADIREGVTTPNPLVYVEEPEGAAEDDNYDFESGDGKRYLELNAILFEAGREFEDNYFATKSPGDGGDDGGAQSAE